MASAETVELPKDRKGRTLHVGDEVLVYRCGKPVAQGEVISMTLICLEPVIWYVCLRIGAIGKRRYRTRCDGFATGKLERIEVGSDDGD